MAKPRLALCAALAMSAALPLPARAHAVEYAMEVERRPDGIAVRAFSAHGRGAPLAGGWVQVFSPADREKPRLEGRTDRQGRFSFVPDSPGSWRVRAVDAGGHGIVAEVRVPPPAPGGSARPRAGAAANASPVPAAAPSPGPEAPPARERFHFGLRTAAAAGAIALAFAALAAFQRRRRG